MTEWKLFDDDAPPDWLNPNHLRDAPWMRLKFQPGFPDRAHMVAELVQVAADRFPVETVSDCGCGDGELLAVVTQQIVYGPDGQPGRLKGWGYELGVMDGEHARHNGLDVRPADIVRDPLEWGDVTVCSEVLEHLADPGAFLRRVSSPLLICTSPSMETGDWHNDIHAWAWDLEGYEGLLVRTGWEILAHLEVDGGMNTFGEQTQPQAFQGILAKKDAL